ncbi:MAG TPA: adenylate/guanylate cyclase domain-containing protein [Chthoniobacterales bacterium]|nr:adenylate/guanylate cyclase domain-containing protein [Chthoniobacterales bacterium]
MSARRILIVSGFAVMVCATLAALEQIRPLAYLRLCNLYRDALARAGRTTSPNPDLVFLAIDAQSVSFDETDINETYHLSGDNSDETHALRLIAKGFPWSREIYGLVLEKLVRAGARVVIFDLNFLSDTPHDASFRARLDRYSDHVMVGSNFVEDGSLVRPCETLIPQVSPSDSRVGFTNFWADEDEVVRRAQFHVTFDWVRGTRTSSKLERFVSLAGGAMMKAGFKEDVPDDLEPHAFRFTASPYQGFPPRSLFEIFVPTYWERDYQSGEFFRNKIVIVGAEGNWQHDDHPTPFGKMPGPELHLNAINAALHHEFIREFPPLAKFICIGLAALGAIVIGVLFRSLLIRLVLVVLVAHASILASMFCFNHASFYLPIVSPLGAFGMTTLFGLICDFASERIEKNRVRRVLERYVSRDLVHQLVDSPDVYRDSLGGVTKPVAILFSDIRSYSIVTATTPPQTLVAQLNEYFSAMVDCVFQNGGTLDKFIGDALMASWGSLDSAGPRQDAIASVRAALAMQDRLRLLNEAWKQRGWPELRVGMAVNYGDVVVGNIGSSQRMEFTLIGDAVNVSWKLQEMTKMRRGGLIISESVAALVGDNFNLVSLGTATLDDSHQPCEIFTIVQDSTDSNKGQIRNEAWHAGAWSGSKDFPASSPAESRSSR